MHGVRCSGRALAEAEVRTGRVVRSRQNHSSVTAVRHEVICGRIRVCPCQGRKAAREGRDGWFASAGYTPFARMPEAGGPAPAEAMALAVTPHVNRRRASARQLAGPSTPGQRPYARPSRQRTRSSSDSRRRMSRAVPSLWISTSAGRRR